MTQIIDLLVSYLKNNPNKNIRTIAKDLSISQSLVSQTLYEYTNVFELNKNTNLWIFIFKFDTDNLSYVDDNILGEVCLFDYTDQYLNYIEETNENYSDNELDFFLNVSETYSNINLIVNYDFTLPQISNLNKLDYTIVDLVYFLKYKVCTRGFYKDFSSQTNYLQKLIKNAYDKLRFNLSQNSSVGYIIDRKFANNIIFSFSNENWVEYLGSNKLSSVLNISKHENKWLIDIRFSHLKFYSEKIRSLPKVITFLNTNLSEFLYHNYKVSYLWENEISDDILKLPLSLLCNLTNDSSLIKLFKLMEYEYKFNSFNELNFFHPECLYMMSNVEYNELLALNYKIQTYFGKNP